VKLLDQVCQPLRVKQYSLAPSAVIAGNDDESRSSQVGQPCKERWQMSWRSPVIVAAESFISKESSFANMKNP